MTAENLDQSHYQVFISHASADSDIAGQLADALVAADTKVWLDTWELAPGDSIEMRVEQGLASSDILLVLLSPRSVESRWVQREISSALSRELHDRAITVIPALIQDCKIPPFLAEKQIIDLTKNRPESVQKLVTQIRSMSNLDFSNFDGKKFEKMTLDLLCSLGFGIIRQNIDATASGFDFVASYQLRDPFNTQQTELWLVETKLYKSERVSVLALQKIIDSLKNARGYRGGLVVTNSLLTSVAREFVADSTKNSTYHLRIIDGAELKFLLMQNQDIVNKYFIEH